MLNISTNIDNINKQKYNYLEVKEVENIICKSCGTQFTGEVCPKCGYNINISKLFENGITNKKYKEHLADSALAILVNNKLISKEKDLILID